MTDEVEVGVRVSRLGNKSLDMEYLIKESVTGIVFAEGKTVQVAYDYHDKKTRQKIVEVVEKTQGDLHNELVHTIRSFLYSKTKKRPVVLTTMNWL